MYNDEIEEELRNCSQFYGVYMSDTIPTRRELLKRLMMSPARRQGQGGGGEGRGLVVNLDSIGSSGTHWVALWLHIADGSGEYFDSFGSPPPSLLAEKISNLCPNGLKINRCCLQHHSSSTCGLYTIFYIKHKCMGKSLENILLHFTSSHEINEVIIKSFDSSCK